MSVNPRINITTVNSIDTKTACFDSARYYDPSLERFLGEDPIGFASEDFNWYRYASSSPITYTDPYGYKVSGVWKGSPRSYYGLNLNFSLTNPNINDWLDVNFIRIRATASGMVFASVLCQDIDECKGSREWTINIRLDYSITMEETFGINGAAAAIAKFHKPLGVALGGLILGSKISLFTYKVRSAWNNWAEATINELLKNGPTALCKGSQ